VTNLYKLGKVFPFGFYRHYTIEKQWYVPSKLPGMAYLFEWKGGISHTCVNENAGQPSGFVEKIYGEKHDIQIIK